MAPDGISPGLGLTSRTCIPISLILVNISRPLFTKRTGVLPQEMVKSRSCEVGYHNDRIDLTFDRHFGSAAACQISERLEKSKPESRGFESSRDLTVRCPSAHLKEALGQANGQHIVDKTLKCILLNANLAYFYSNFNVICWPTDTNSSLVLDIAWRRIVPSH